MKELIFLDALRESMAYKLLQNDFQLGLGHAYMIVSPDDDVVADFFSLIATTAFCKDHVACQTCPDCLTVLHNNHPDIFQLNPQREKIKVGDIKELSLSINIKALSQHKLYFIERADLMSVDAQNKLLKTLEEPPLGVTIFLGVANESSMLPTIKSRCRSIHMDLFDQQTIVGALTKLHCADELCSVAAACSEGKLGNAYKIALSTEYAEAFKCAIALLSGLKKSVDILSFDSLPAIHKNTAEFLDVLSIILRDILVSKQNSELIRSKHISENIAKLSKLYSSHALSEIIFLCVEARKKLSQNVNPLATIDSLLFSILEVKYKWQ